MILLSQAPAADSPRYSKKCASLTSQPGAPRSRPEVAMVRTLHAHDRNPHHVGALHKLRATRRVGQTLFKRTRHRREAMIVNGRLPCAIRLGVAQRVSIMRDDTARPRKQADTKNVSDSWSTVAVVVFWRASYVVVHCVGSAVGTGITRPGPVGSVDASLEKFAIMLSEPSAARSRTLLSTASTTCLVIANPPFGSAWTGPCVRKLLSINSTCRFRTRAEPSRSGEWAASVRC
jgi:hypothetical protein